MAGKAKYVTWDLETHNAGTQYGMEPDDFFRLGTYKFDDGPVQVTTSRQEMLDVIQSTPYNISHNGISFDLPVLFGHDSVVPLKLAQEKRVIDTLVLATLVHPVPYEYRNPAGQWITGANHPKKAMAYYSLENLTHQLRLPGKFGSLQELARKHNPPGTVKDDLDYGLIPLDDPDFIQYALQDTDATWGLFLGLMRRKEEQDFPGDYIWREMELMSVLARMSSNGIRPDEALARQKSLAQQETVDNTVRWLEAEFDFPTEGKAPWKSNAGKAAILKALAAFGVTPDHPDWGRTASGAPSFSGDTMLAVTRGTPAERLGEALSQLQGLRSMPDLILSSVKGDGRMHPRVTAFQKSGRFSLYDPSVLIFNAEHKDMLLADEGCFTVELDFSNADARAVAAMSGDESFAQRFEVNPDGSAKYDGHNLSGEVFFGYDLYHADCGGDCGRGCKPALRPAAKAATLALGYNVGGFKLAELLNKAAKAEGLDIEFWCSEESYWGYKKAREAEGLEAWPEGEWLQSIRREGMIHTRELIRNYNLEYAEVKAWKDRVVEEGDRVGYVTNSWGRRMAIDFAGAGWDAPEGRRSRSYTASPALLGQSTTRELMADFLIRMGREGEKWARSLRGVIHDAVVVDLPKETIDEDVLVVQGLMQADFDPGTRTGMKIAFPAGIGPLDGLNWQTGSH